MNIQRTAWEDARHSLTWNEFKSGTHVESQIGRSPRWIPAFAADEFQFRSVLVQAVVQYVFRGHNVPQTVSNDLGYLRALAADSFTRECFGRAWDDSYFAVMIGHIQAVKKAGGILQMLAAIMYRAWKLHWHDSEIAEELGLTAPAVAKQRAKLLRIAKKLGYPTYPPTKRRRETFAPAPSEAARHRRAGKKYRATERGKELARERKKRWRVRVGIAP
jgi:hypothetical protein